MNKLKKIKEKIAEETSEIKLEESHKIGSDIFILKWDIYNGITVKNARPDINIVTFAVTENIKEFAKKMIDFADDIDTIFDVFYKKKDKEDKKTLDF